MLLLISPIFTPFVNLSPGLPIPLLLLKVILVLVVACKLLMELEEVTFVTVTLFEELIVTPDAELPVTFIDVLMTAL